MVQICSKADHTTLEIKKRCFLANMSICMTGGQEASLGSQRRVERVVLAFISHSFSSNYTRILSIKLIVQTWCHRPITQAIFSSGVHSKEDMSLSVVQEK